jgi:threonine dehydratase
LIQIILLREVDMSKTLILPSLEEINQAEILLNEKRIRSSLIQSSTDPHLFLKLDSQLPGGSYKIRGVEFFTKNLSCDNKTVEVLSAGNLAIASAMRFNESKIHTTAIVPQGISAIKQERLKQAGACIQEKSFSQIWDLVLDDKLRQSQVFLHPFNKFLLAGYATIISEIKQSGFKQGALVIPYGLGGLALALAQAIEVLNMDLQLYICEIAGFAPFSRALKTLQPIEGPLLKSFIEAMGTPAVINDVFNFLKQRIAGVIIVTEADVKQAIHSAFYEHGLQIEGAAAASLAATRKLTNNKNVIAILTGSNISDEVFSSITAKARV